jgi:hypothetical protein
VKPASIDKKEMHVIISAQVDNLEGCKGSIAVAVKGSNVIASTPLQFKALGLSDKSIKKLSPTPDKLEGAAGNFILKFTPYPTKPTTSTDFFAIGKVELISSGDDALSDAPVDFYSNIANGCSDLYLKNVLPVQDRHLRVFEVITQAADDKHCSWGLIAVQNDAMVAIQIEYAFGAAKNYL